MTSAQLCSESLAVSDLEFSQLRERALALGTVIEHDDCSISAFGRAEAIPLPNGLGDPARLAAVTVRLAEIARRAPGGGRSSDRDPSGLPLALGALPFRPDRPGTLVVPEVVAISSKGAPRVVMVTARGEGRTTLDRLLGARPAAQSAPPDSFRLESARPHEEYLERVALAVDEVRSGRLEKVVLAREVLIEANRAWRQGDLLEHLRSLHPSCTTFFVDGFLGATPELLVRRSGELF
ncbi:MAG: chorismate-binding protein, partial [Acidimicrobiales bacterium]